MAAIQITQSSEPSFPHPNTYASFRGRVFTFSSVRISQRGDRFVVVVRRGADIGYHYSFAVSAERVLQDPR